MLAAGLETSSYVDLNDEVKIRNIFLTKRSRGVSGHYLTMKRHEKKFEYSIHHLEYHKISSGIKK